MIPIIADPEKHDAPVDAWVVTAKLFSLLVLIVVCMIGICYVAYSIGGK